MSKVILANRVEGNILLKGLIADGSLLTFSATGKFMGVRDMFSTPIADMQEVDVVSILSQKGCVEIAFNINQIFSTIPASVEEIVYNAMCCGLEEIVFEIIKVIALCLFTLLSIFVSVCYNMVLPSVMLGEKKFIPNFLNTSICVFFFDFLLEITNLQIVT